jgi:hypothetical protein
MSCMIRFPLRPAPAQSGSGVSRLSYSASAVLSLTLAMVLPTSLAAQTRPPDSTIVSDTTKTKREWMSGLAFAVPSAGGEVFVPATSVGMSIVRVKPYRIGPDVAVLFVPQTLLLGFALGGARLNLGVPLTLGPNLALLPSAGFTVVAGAGAGFGALGAGANGSLSVLLLDGFEGLSTSKYALRLGASFHRPVAAGSGTLRLFELGVVRR